MGGLSLSIILLLIEFGVRVALGGVILLRRRFDPTVRLAWLMVVLLLPIVGAVAYLLVGETRLGKKRIKRHQEVVLRQSRQAAQLLHPAAPHPRIPEPYSQIALLAESVAGNRPRAGNRLQLFGDNEPAINSMLADTANARRHVHLLTYIYRSDRTGARVAEVLVRAEARNVQCRVLADAVGSGPFLASSLAEEMRAGGVQVESALPASPFRALLHRLDLRNHRKMMMIDGRIAYTGSQNIADASFAPKRRFSPWVDATVRIEGPVVHDLQQVFCEDWYLDTNEWLEDTLALPEGGWGNEEGEVIAQCFATGPNAYNYAARQLIQAALHLAREELILTTPYFVPDDATVSAMMTAARRGVETCLVLPARNDSWLVAAASRSYYASLLEAGVRIFEYRPGLLHAKTLTIDRDLAIVTSANLDRRSLFLNFESGLIVYDTDFASQLRFLQESYLSDCDEMAADRWQRRSWPKRLWQNAAGMVSPLL